MGRKRNRINLKSNHLDLSKSFINHLDYQRKEEDSLYYNGYYNGCYYPEIYTGNGDYWDEYYDEYDYWNGYGYHKKRRYEDEEDDYRDVDIFDEFSKRKLNKKSKSRKNKKKEKVESKTYTDYDSGYALIEDKIIYYYPDYLDSENRKVFNNIYEFDTFLDEEGIHVPEEETTNLLNRNVSHCSLNPKSRLKDGVLELISSNSYLDLKYNCSDLESYDEMTSEEASTFAM